MRTKDAALVVGVMCLAVSLGLLTLLSHELVPGPSALRSVDPVALLTPSSLQALTANRSD